MCDEALVMYEYSFILYTHTHNHTHKQATKQASTCIRFDFVWIILQAILILYSLTK